MMARSSTGIRKSCDWSYEHTGRDDDGIEIVVDML